MEDLLIWLDYEISKTDDKLSTYERRDEILHQFYMQDVGYLRALKIVRDVIGGITNEKQSK